MREKRYYKSMKGTQGKEGERQAFFDVLSLKRKAKREINEREGGFEEAYMELSEDGAKTEKENMLKLYFFGKTNSEPEEKKEKVKEIIREVFAGAGLEMKETERGNNTTAFSIKGKPII